MKRKVVFFVALCGLLFLVSCTITKPATPTPAVEQSVASDRETCTKLRVSGAVGWNPYMMKEEGDEKAAGVGLDLIYKMAAELQIPDVVVIDDIPWSRLFYMLDDGSLDVIVASYWTSERSEKYLYTIPYWQDEARVFTLKGQEFSFEKWEDLQGKVGGRPLGGSYGEEFDKFAKEYLTFEEVQGKEALFTKLELNRNEYVVFAYWDAMIYLQQTGLNQKVVALPKPIIENPVHLLFSKNTACADLVPQIDRLLEEYIKNGAIENLIGNYMDIP